VNPRIGSALKHARAVGTEEMKPARAALLRMEEEAVEVVRNHEGGTRTGGWHLSPRRWFESELARDRAPGVDSPTRDDGGAIFGQPQERKLESERIRAV
jgi:hypothetical protein